MEQIFETFRIYLDNSADADMLKANPNLVKDVHDGIFSRIREDYKDKELPDHQTMATKYFAAYVNDLGKAKFFPPGFFPK